MSARCLVNLLNIPSATIKLINIACIRLVCRIILRQPPRSSFPRPYPPNLTSKSHHPTQPVSSSSTFTLLPLVSAGVELFLGNKSCLISLSLPDPWTPQATARAWRLPFSTLSFSCFCSGSQAVPCHYSTYTLWRALWSYLISSSFLEFS